MEDALRDMPALRQFAKLSSLASIPDETTILNFRHPIESNELAPEIPAGVNRHLSRKGLMVKRGNTAALEQQSLPHQVCVHPPQNLRRQFVLLQQPPEVQYRRPNCAHRLAPQIPC